MDWGKSAVETVETQLSSHEKSGGFKAKISLQLLGEVASVEH
jgi:hypothetical protein